MALRLVMMGTGGFALPTFLALYETSHRVVGLFTQPDRGGRGHHHHPHPIKDAAQERGTPVLQPARVNTDESLADLRALDPDLCIVAAYGQILSPALLKIPRDGAVNLHASLLPKYRGAAPIQYAICRGETETGVTIFQIEPQLDAGPVLAMEQTPIGPKETAGQLEQRLAQLAVPLTLAIIDRLETGTAEPILQDSGSATRAPRLSKSDGVIDWSKSAAEIDCHIRAMQPWPSPYTFLQSGEGKSLRVIMLDVEAVGGDVNGPAGTILQADDDHGLVVGTGTAAVRILRLQPEGKRAMSAVEFLRGHTIRIGDHLRDSPPSA